MHLLYVINIFSTLCRFYNLKELHPKYVPSLWPTMYCLFSRLCKTFAFFFYYCIKRIDNFDLPLDLAGPMLKTRVEVEI